jgi:peptidoglycan/xylan/chitin deacetylase (PgdA/CDA1 family)
MDIQRLKYLLLISLIVCFLLGFFFLKASSLEFKQTKLNTGIISLSFDDGYSSHYNFAYPLMKKYGFKGTEYLVANWSGKFENKTLINFDEARKMQSDGWEIGSHSLNHPNLVALSINKLNEELKLSKEILINNEFNISSIAFPYGYYNKNVSSLIRNYYSSARPLINGYNIDKTQNLYELKSKWVVKDSNFVEVCNWVKYAKLNNLWLILVFHNIEDSPTEYWSVSTEGFQEVLKCINESKIEVKTITEAINEKRN